MSKKEEDSCLVVDHQEKVVIHEFQDPFVNLLQPSREMSFILFMDHVHMLSGHLEWPSFCLFYMLKESTRRIKISSHLQV